MINHKGLLTKSQYRGKNSGFLTLFLTVYRALGTVTVTSNNLRLKTLLTVMDTGLTELIILPFSIAAQEKVPIPTPLLTLAHGSLRSGVSRPGRFPSGGFC